MRFYEQLPLSSDKPCFRLLQLEASDEQDDALRGSAATYDIGTRCDVEYDALSYCWGAFEEPQHITLNGEAILISKNLASALRQVRDDQQMSGISRKLWVDAVCINQGDNAEKSHQVMLMTDIYANANRVLSWIGDADEHTALAFDTLRRFSDDDGTLDASVTASRLAAETEARTTAVRSFVQRQYFFRMWIVQEVVAAKTVTLFCGPHSINFDTASTAIQRMTGSGYYPFSPETANLIYVEHWRNAYHGLESAEDEELDLRLFLDTRDRSATDPKDKIYSLRGITKKRITDGIRVNYDDPVRKVYTDFTKLMLKIRPDLQILSAVMAKHRAHSVHELPSYVPDWGQPKYGGGFLQRYYRFKPTHLFRASGETKPVVDTEPGSNGIRFEGVRVDTITRIIDIKSLLSRSTDKSTSVTELGLRELAADAISSTIYPFTTEPAWMAYFRTLTADRSALSPRIADSYRSANFARFSDVDLQHPDRIPAAIPASLWDEISRTVETIIEDKVMFVTAKGYLGLGQEACKVGDTVCIFLGGEVPFVVRAEHYDEADGYQFLGECYVHGIMDGEAMNENCSLEQFLLL